MNILIAPNSMKGSLDAFEFADIVEAAFLKCSSDFTIRKIPVADGGDFTGEVLKRALKAEEIKVEVKGPFDKLVSSRYAQKDKTAIIEMADASGVKLVKDKELNPLKASSYGTGQLFAEAIKKGCDEIFIGIGGSATVDGGSGMIEALGFELKDENDKLLKGGGDCLTKVRSIDKPNLSKELSIKIICDVDNPLLGERGAAAVFGPQKGATPEMVTLLEKGLENWVGILEKMSNKELANLNGAGAAGGIALPLIAFFNAEIVPGADFILSQLNFKDHVKWADIVITGEGKIDGQTLNTKAPMAVSQIAGKYKKPVFAFGGSVQPEASKLFDGIFSMVNEPLTLEYAMQNAREMLFNFSHEFAKVVYRLQNKNG